MFLELSEGCFNLWPELQHVSFVCAGEPHAGKPTTVVNAGMKLKSVVPSLPVLAKGGYALGYFMSVGSNEPTDWQHCAVDEAKGRGSRQQGSRK